MGGLSIWHMAILIALIAILFGRGRISAFMSDLGTGIRDFRRTLKAASSRDLDEEDIRKD